MICQLNPTIPVETPKGNGWAHFIFEHGDEHHIQWHVAIDETGEWWTFNNPEVRIQPNWTMGRRKGTTLKEVMHLHCPKCCNAGHVELWNDQFKYHCKNCKNVFN